MIANASNAEYTEERWLATIERQGVPVYLYHNGTLVFISNYKSEIGLLWRFSDSWVNDTITKSKGIYRKVFYFSTEYIPDMPVDILSTAQLTTLHEDLLKIPILGTGNSPTLIAFNIVTGDKTSYSGIKAAGDALGRIQRKLKDTIVNPYSLPVDNKTLVRDNVVLLFYVDDADLMQQAYQFVISSNKTNTRTHPKSATVLKPIDS